MRAFNTKPVKGFTLLEMLIALALGALLMAAISTFIVPLLATTRSSSSPDGTTQQAQVFIDNVRLIANKGTAKFPSAIDRGVARTSLAIQFLGTGQDMSADANQDGFPGIAHMDTTADRATSISSKQDDDRDGLIDEDWVNGLDDDGDGLVDEDPGINDDDEYKAGLPYVDDNNDSSYDTAVDIALHQTKNPWTPFLPNSLVSLSTYNEGGTDYARFSLLGTSYSVDEDDNEDGVTNNNPMVTWSARLEGDKILCTTPLLSHQTATTSGETPFHLFDYHEYTCLENVQNFQVLRSYSKSGAVLFTVQLSFTANGELQTINRNVYFP